MRVLDRAAVGLGPRPGPGAPVADPDYHQLRAHRLEVAHLLQVPLQLADQLRLEVQDRLAGGRQQLCPPSCGRHR